jgi:hypothetical protein
MPTHKNLIKGFSLSRLTPSPLPQTVACTAAGTAWKAGTAAERTLFFGPPPRRPLSQVKELHCNVIECDGI